MESNSRDLKYFAYYDLLVMILPRSLSRKRTAIAPYGVIVVVYTESNKNIHNLVTPMGSADVRSATLSVIPYIHAKRLRLGDVWNAYSRENASNLRLSHARNIYFGVFFFFFN